VFQLRRPSERTRYRREALPTPIDLIGRVSYVKYTFLAESTPCLRTFFLPFLDDSNFEFQKALCLQGFKVTIL
jgi:hypothetical protein